MRLKPELEIESADSWRLMVVLHSLFVSRARARA